MLNSSSKAKPLAWLALLSLVLFGAPAYAEDAVKVEAVGQAAIYGKDVAQARDKAIDDARRKAVEQAIGSMVSSETVTENFQLISDKILSNSSDLFLLAACQKVGFACVIAIGF